jgi:hypothetical protein
LLEYSPDYSSDFSRYLFVEVLRQFLVEGRKAVPMKKFSPPIMKEVPPHPYTPLSS